MIRRALTALAASGLVLASCVTEPARPSRGVAVRSDRTPATAPARSDRAPARLPEGPIADPATDARSVNSSVSVALAPLGTFPYDAQTLPVVSADGRFAATQLGEAPTWATILNQRGASPPVATSIEAYDLTVVPAKRIDWPNPAPPGAILSPTATADGTGFSAERITPDGGRQIGAVSWVTGTTNWREAPGRALSSFTVRAEQSAWTDRAIDEQTAALVLRTSRAEHRRSERGVSHLFPVVDSRAAGAFVWALDSRGDLELLLVEPVSGGRTAVRARRALAREADPLVAYQSASVASVPPPGEDRAERLLLFFDPAAARMSVFDASTGGVTALVPNSIAGAWLRDAGGLGVFLTTDDGLVFQRLERSGNAWRASPSVRVLADPWVPRATTDPDRPYILIGPGGPGQEGRLRLFAMRIVPTDQ